MKQSVRNEEKKNRSFIFSNEEIKRNVKRILFAGTIIAGLTLPTNSMAAEPQRGGDRRVRVESRQNNNRNKEMKVNKVNHKEKPQVVNSKPAPRPQNQVHKPAPRPAVVHKPAPPVHVVHKPAPPVHVVHHPAPPVHVVHRPAPPVHVVHRPAPLVHVVHHCDNDVANATAVAIGVIGLISLLAN